MSDDKSAVRRDPRSTLALDLSSHLVASGDRHPIRALAVDISRNGLGIVCFEELSPQSDVILSLKERGIVLKTAWCKPDTVRKGIFHVGLGTNDPAINLPKLLEREGLLKGAKPDAGAGDAAFTFDDVRRALATARMPDPSVLRNANLTKLGSSHHAYPVNVRGQSLFVLLPKTLRPADAGKLTDEEAATQNVAVLKEEGGRLTKAWPKA